MKNKSKATSFSKNCLHYCPITALAVLSINFVNPVAARAEIDPSIEVEIYDHEPALEYIEPLPEADVFIEEIREPEYPELYEDFEELEAELAELKAALLEAELVEAALVEYEAKLYELEAALVDAELAELEELEAELAELEEVEVEVELYETNS